MKKTSIIVCMVWLAGLSSFATLISFQEGDLRVDGSLTDVNYTSQATWVFSNPANTNSNYNANKTLLIGRDGSTGYLRHGLLSFDLSYIKTLTGGAEYTINSVTLNLYQYADNGMSGDAAFRMSQTSAFDETTATWSNTGGGSETMWLSTSTIPAGGTAGTVCSWSGASWITAVSNALADASSTLYLMGRINNETAANAVLTIDAENYSTGEFRPELVVDVTIIPEPASVGLLGLGLGCVLFIRRYLFK